MTLVQREWKKDILLRGRFVIYCKLPVCVEFHMFCLCSHRFASCSAGSSNFLKNMPVGELTTQNCPCEWVCVYVALRLTGINLHQGGIPASHQGFLIHCDLDHDTAFTEDKWINVCPFKKQSTMLKNCNTVFLGNWPRTYFLKYYFWNIFVFLPLRHIIR